MAGTFTPVRLCSGFGPIQGFGSIHCTCSARTLRGKSNRSDTRATKYFLHRAAAIGTCQGSDSEVCCRTTALWLPCNCTPPGTWRTGVQALGGRRLISALFFPSDRRCVLSIYRLPFSLSPTRSTPVESATVLLPTVTVYLISF